MASSYNPHFSGTDSQKNTNLTPKSTSTSLSCRLVFVKSLHACLGDLYILLGRSLTIMPLQTKPIIGSAWGLIKIMVPQNCPNAALSDPFAPQQNRDRELWSCFRVRGLTPRQQKHKSSQVHICRCHSDTKSLANDSHIHKIIYTIST